MSRIGPDLLRGERAHDEPAAIGDAVLRLGTLLRHAAIVAEALPAPTAESHVAFSFEHDRAAFAAALLGCWAAGHAVALPSDARRERVAPVLGRPEIAAFVQDTGVGRGIHVPTLLATATGSEAPAHSSLPEGRVVLSAFVGDDRGETTPLRYTADALLASVDDLSVRLAMPRGAAVVCSTAPTFLWSVLAGVLLPLRTGAVLVTDAVHSARSLAEVIASRSAHTLVASPAHLRNLARSPSLAPLAQVVCVAGTLDRGTAASLDCRHRVRVHELAEGDPRTSLDGAAAAEPVGREPLGRDAPVAATARSGAEGRASAGTPHAVSPADAVVAALLGVEGVDDAAAVEVRESESRLVLAAVSPRLEAGERTLEARAERAARGPVEVRSFAALPRDPNGALPPSVLFRLFDRGPDGARRTRDLTWCELPATDGGRRFRTRIARDYLYFAGHFESHPVLAGAVQLRDLVLPCLSRVVPGDLRVTRWSGIKFTAEIGPGQEVDVLVRAVPSEGTAAFDVMSGDVRCTTGRLSFTRVEP